jgi:hypothetical protein
MGQYCSVRRYPRHAYQLYESPQLGNGRVHHPALLSFYQYHCRRSINRSQPLRYRRLPAARRTSGRLQFRPTYAGKALTIYYQGSLASNNPVFIHWGENNWQNTPADQARVKRADGFWQTTISIPNDATQINFALNNGSGVWGNNNGQNWNVTISNSCASGTATSNPCTPVAGNAVQLFYNGSLASSASCITVHWGHSNWNSVTDTVMTRQHSGR